MFTPSAVIEFDAVIRSAY